MEQVATDHAPVVPVIPGERWSEVLQARHLANNAHSTTALGCWAEFDGRRFYSRYSVHNDWFMIAAWAGLAAAIPVLRRLWDGLRGTALEHAWFSTILVWLIWLFVPMVSVFPIIDHGWNNCLWYLAAVSALLPPIAALGARRPINRAWTWFVLLPLFLVFAWPVMPAVWSGTANPHAFDLETPMVLGMLLVSVMGVGNYLGSAQTLSAVLWLTAIWLVVLPLCPATAGWFHNSAVWRSVALACLAASGWLGYLQRARQRPASTSLPLDRLWNDYRELFGVVWARRLMDRFNDDARSRKAKFHLAWLGLETATGARPDPNVDQTELAAAETSLRWLLQKFVDADWIDQRISPAPEVALVVNAPRA